jgi:hypothetical protein
MAIGKMLRAMVDVPGAFDEAVSTRPRAFISRTGFRTVSGVLRCH